MIIVPTRLCNTNSCTYCSVYKKDFDKRYFKDIDLEDFYKKIIILSGKSNDYEIRFFWWEPFLEFDTIKKIILFIKWQTDTYHFVINTNLTLLDEKKLQFIKENNVKLIISCNGKITSHKDSRGISIKSTLDLYKNIRNITKNNISHQINIVVDSNNAKNLKENLFFIQNYLEAKNINLLPVNFNVWSNNGLEDLKKSFDEIIWEYKKWALSLHFINKEVQNEVLLFNSEIVIDSDWKAYPSMVILESFFQEVKMKILLTDLWKKYEEVTIDLENYFKDNSKIYSLFINKFLEKKFKDTIANDYISSELFHDFLIHI